MCACACMCLCTRVLLEARLLHFFVYSCEHLTNAFLSLFLPKCNVRQAGVAYIPPECDAIDDHATCNPNVCVEQMLPPLDCDLITRTITQWSTFLLCKPVASLRWSTTTPVLWLWMQASVGEYEEAQVGKWAHSVCKHCWTSMGEHSLVLPTYAILCLAVLYHIYPSRTRHQCMLRSVPGVDFQDDHFRRYCQNVMLSAQCLAGWEKAGISHWTRKILRHVRRQHCWKWSSQNMALGEIITHTSCPHKAPPTLNESHSRPSQKLAQIIIIYRLPFSYEWVLELFSKTPSLKGTPSVLHYLVTYGLFLGKSGKNFH